MSYVGYEVDFVVNITDVDDKLIARARELGTTVKDLAGRMTADYLECLRRLNVTGLTHLPKATEHIPEMLRLIEGLVARGYAYPADGDVYFDVTRDEEYGKLSRRNPEEMEAGARVEVSEKKRNPGDFALWKGSKPGEPAWDSPWGPGRPGWHIECSAMSMKYLGQTLDIHGGGLDLQFPHHENELAQSESYTGHTFARYWMHNGLLKMGTAKMAGSVGNVVNVVDLLKQHSPATVRFLLLSTHYRSPIEWSDERLAEVGRSLEAFYRFFERYERITKTSFYALVPPGKRDGYDRGASPSLHDSNPHVIRPDSYPPNVFRYFEIDRLRNSFLSCMDDDFNTGGAVGTLYELLTALNRFADTRNLESAKADAAALEELRQGALVLRELSQILGLFQQPPAEKKLGGDDKLVAGLMQLLIDVRNNLRAEAKKITAKDDPVKKALFAQTDVIRKRLGEIGVTLEDRPGGTGWRVG